MSLRVYNTLRNAKEEFVPSVPGKVSMYVCGVTPYNHPHIGNARPFVTWDVIRRYFEYKGFEVNHIQNFTDVDDKIINTARQEAVSWDIISERYIASYFEVMDRLNIKRADIFPKVSGHMNEIVDMVKVLIEKGFAYEMDGDVYFSLEAFDHYGQLSGRNIEDMKAGARVDVDDRKRHPMDFALWKAAKPGEPSWESPWGLGRPGWHIECSAMSLKYLGTSFDFHGGGSDLIFPHHENEIAQSEAFSGVSPFVRYWLHNGFVTVNEEKMSKSLGNFFLVKDILERYSPEVLRLFILSTHYRSPLDFSDQRLDEAQKNLQRLSIAAETSKRALEHPKVDERETAESGQLIADADEARKEFEDAMDDDFNTALAITALFSMAKVLNSYGNAVLRDEISCNRSALMRAHETYAELSGILGLILKADAKEPMDDQLIDDLMGIILDLRKGARDKKDWAVADEIRNRLKPLGIVIEDSAQGARWKRS